MHLVWRQAIEVLETENQRAPFVGVDTIRLPIGQDVGAGVDLVDFDMQGKGAAPSGGISVRDRMSFLQFGFQLDRAFHGARGFDGQGGNGQAAMTDAASSRASPAGGSPAWHGSSVPTGVEADIDAPARSRPITAEASTRRRTIRLFRVGPQRHHPKC